MQLARVRALITQPAVPLFAQRGQGQLFRLFEQRPLDLRPRLLFHLGPVPQSLLQEPPENLFRRVVVFKFRELRRPLLELFARRLVEQAVDAQDGLSIPTVFLVETCDELVPFLDDPGAGGRVLCQVFEHEAGFVCFKELVDEFFPLGDPFVFESAGRVSALFANDRRVLSRERLQLRIAPRAQSDQGILRASFRPEFVFPTFDRRGEFRLRLFRRRDASRSIAVLERVSSRRFLSLGRFRAGGFLAVQSVRLNLCLGRHRPNLPFRCFSSSKNLETIGRSFHRKSDL